jgi:peptide/nickel transport system permease protein
MRNGLIMARDLPIPAIILLLPVVICGIFGPIITPYDPDKINPAYALQPPSWLVGKGGANILGTDALGRDVASRIIAGARSTLIVSIVGVALAGAAGVILGVIAAYFEGWLDTVIMRIVDIQMSMPSILLAILISAALGPGLLTVTVVIAIAFWTQYARIIRGETLTVKQRDFVVMARVMGCSPFKISVKHIFPHIIDSAVVVGTLQLGIAVMVEAALSFLGLGVQPPAVAWGKMISEARLYLSTAWWVPTFPGLAIMITVLGANLWGDWLRDKLDPQLRQI